MEWMILPLKRYAQFRGRSRRKEFWMFILFTIIVNIALLAIMATAGGTTMLAAMSGDNPIAVMTGGGIIGVTYIISVLFSLAVLIPWIAVTVRRLHDTDRTGWWVLAPLLPYLGIFVLVFGIGTTAASGRNVSSDTMAAVGIAILACGLAWLILSVVILVFMCLDGTQGPNRFGADPKQRHSDLESVFS